MRKLISLLVVIQMVMLLFVPAFAEEFSLRNDIHFGDTKEQVRSKETIPIDEDASKEDKIQTQAGMVAGFDGVEISYRFSVDDKLEEVKWDIFYADIGESDKAYEKLQKAMTSKYGGALGYTNGTCYIITSEVIEDAVEIVGLFQMYNGVADIRNYDEWDYEYQPGKHVKIEIIEYYYGNYGYWVNVGYKFFTDEDLTAAMAEKQAENEEKQAENQKVINDI